MARIGIIGTGWGSRVQVPAFRRAGLEVVAIAGRDAARTRKIAADLGIEPFDTAEALIDHAAVDLVSIVSPPKTHRPYALRALERGRHVLCEKPTALDEREAEQMLEAARRHSERLSLIDHELRFLPSWREAKRRIGEIGPIRWAEVRYASPSRNDPQRAWNWWSDAAQHGGVWGAVGSHFVDALRWFAGEITAAQAVLETFLRRRPLPGGGELREVTADDFTAVHLRLDSGAVAAMLFTVVAAVDEETALTLVGERGAFRLVRDRLLHADVKGAWREVVGEEGEPFAGDSPGGFFGTGTIHLGRALRAHFEGDRDALAPAATFLDGFRQQQVLDAARRSHHHGGAWEPVAR